MDAIVKKLKAAMELHNLSREKISHILDCSPMTVYRWLTKGHSPGLISTRKIKAGLDKVRKLYPATAYDLAMKAKSLYGKIRQNVTREEKIRLFDINREKGSEAYLAELERLVEKYGKTDGKA